jgi:hypothetical protein
LHFQQAGDGAQRGGAEQTRYDCVHIKQIAVQPNRPEPIPAEEGPALPADPAAPDRLRPDTPQKVKP